jgi:hypothetical protein
MAASAVILVYIAVLRFAVRLLLVFIFLPVWCFAITIIIGRLWPC